MNEKNNKDEVYELDRVIDRYQTYYQILGLENNANITDEKVKKAYENKCAELNLLIKSCGEDFKEIIDSLQWSFYDAYIALKTEDSRRHYQDILDNMKLNKDGVKSDVKIINYRREIKASKQNENFKVALDDNEKARELLMFLFKTYKDKGKDDFQIGQYSLKVLMQDIINIYKSINKLDKIDNDIEKLEDEKVSRNIKINNLKKKNEILIYALDIFYEEYKKFVKQYNNEHSENDEKTMIQ